MSLDSLERSVVEAYHLHHTDKTTLISSDNLRKAYAAGKWQNDMDYHEWLNLILGCNEKIPAIVNALMEKEYVSLFSVAKEPELPRIPLSELSDADLSNGTRLPLPGTEPAANESIVFRGTVLTDPTPEVPSEVLADQTPLSSGEDVEDTDLEPTE